jgi:uncharacterized protein
MKKQVLLIQGAGDGAFKEDEKLAANLRQLLGSSYEVHFPAMQDEDDADYDTWVRQINRELAALEGEITIVGHSVGGSVLLKALCEAELRKSVTAAFLIAAPFWGGEKGWTYDGYETLALPDEANTKLPKNLSLFFYQSKDDEVVPFAHLGLYRETFPKATFREIDGRGHQLKNDLSEIARDLKKLP